MKTDLLLVALPHRERHPSFLVSGSESEFPVSLVGRGRYLEVAHLLEPLLLGYPSGTSSGIVFRRCPLAGVVGDSLRHPLLR